MRKKNPSFLTLIPQTKFIELIPRIFYYTGQSNWNEAFFFHQSEEIKYISQVFHDMGFWSI